MEFQDAVVVVTGGASGIGRACALRFASEGAHVVVADIDDVGAQRVADEISSMDREALSVRCDVGRRSDVESLVDRSVQWRDGVDLFMSNAGVGVGGAVEHIPLEDWEWIMNINLWAHIWAMRRLLPHFLEKEKGYFVHTASSAGTFGVPSLLPYCVTKFAVVGLAESLAVYGRDRGIGVSVVCPLLVSTNIVDGTRTTPDIDADPQTRDRQKHLMRTMMSEMGISPEKVADDVVDAVREERLYVFPHPELSGILEAKLADPDAWVRQSADMWRSQREAMDRLLTD